MKIKQDLVESYAVYVEENSKDPYSKEVVTRGEMFGNAIDGGKSFEEAESIMVKDSGLTGFMVGALMSACSRYHERGDEIKEWWNKRSGGEPDENGVNNPAIMTITDK